MIDGSCKPPKMFYCDRNHTAYSIIFPVFCEVPTINILNIDYRTFSHYHNKAADKKGRDQVFSPRRKIPPAGLPFQDPARGYLIDPIYQGIFQFTCIFYMFMPAKRRPIRRFCTACFNRQIPWTVISKWSLWSAGRQYCGRVRAPQLSSPPTPICISAQRTLV